nr:MAG TPA: hypothetical protein [Caudoviricetes sp.]
MSRPFLMSIMSKSPLKVTRNRNFQGAFKLFSNVKLRRLVGL